MIIHVTAEDIKNGKSSNPYGCPVALALIRATGKSCVVTNILTTVDEKKFPLPVFVKKFIDNFDAGNPVSPIRFYYDNTRHC